MYECCPKLSKTKEVNQARGLKHIHVLDGTSSVVYIHVDLKFIVLEVTTYKYS